MRDRGIHLTYSFESRGQGGAQIENPLFDLLSALQQHGSIRQAAQAMGASYRHVWGALKHWEDMLGESLVVWMRGRHAQLTPFAQRLVWAERQARTRMTPHIEALRAELQHVLTQALEGGFEVLDLFASHDLALPHLRELAAREHGLHLSLRFAGSVDALRALEQGRCTVAGFHFPMLEALPAGSPTFAHALKPLLRPGQHKLIGSHRRSQGLMMRPGCGVASLVDLTAGGPRFINRQTGSGTRLLMDHLLAQHRIDARAIDGYLTRHEDSHLAVAAALAAGHADVGPGIEAAARQFGLAFMPLVDENYFLVCLKDALDTPAVQRLRAALTSPAWPQLLATLPGHAPQQPGEVLSLTRALPWWNYRQPKPAARQRS
jgi:putative molybdopterin biosynthesis protein